ncbi:MAG: HTTM domain-containing protein [Chitinophagales bacterium]
MQPYIHKQTPISPLITFRILFGALMMWGGLRFVWNGWIEKLYLEPRFFFKFYGFEWVQPLGKTGMYLLFGVVIVSSFCIALGLFYRIAAIVFFLSFTYIELIDATNYLNHYYLVCLFAFLLIFLPANRAFSLDVWRKPQLKLKTVPAWCINILILQLTIVYTCAGIAKLNSDWLFRAMPLAVWLPEHTDLPVLGYFFQFKETAYVFSWIGALYDLTIAYFLMFSSTRVLAYVVVIVFHGLTYLLFNIGLFPLIMVFSTLVFFPSDFHNRLLGLLGFERRGAEAQRNFKRRDGEVESFFGDEQGDKEVQRKISGKLANNCKFWQRLERYKRWTANGGRQTNPNTIINPNTQIQFLLTIYILIQLLLPFRHYLYNGNVLWTEEGYRFSWRVMLVEKVGQVRFFVEDEETQRKTEIINGRHLTLFQEKQMSVQPDFILQFAHFLAEEYKTRHGMKNPVVTVDAHVALNGRTSQQFIDPNVNLAAIEEGFEKKNWILPFDR